MSEVGNYIVYMHVNRMNGKKYVGITNQKPEYRWRSDGSGYFRSPHFWNAIQKYGWENFDHEILLDGLDRETACGMEKHYISLYKTKDSAFGYNMTDGGDGSSGWKPSEETLQKRSESLKGKNLSESHRDAIRKALIGKEVSDETRERLRESHLGKKLTGHALEVAQANLREICKRRMKEVYCIDEAGNIFEFDSIKSASEFYGEPTLAKNFKSIVLSGKPKNGRIWYYKEGDNNVRIQRI